MAVKYFYDGTCQLPGDHATRDGGEFMGDTNEVRGASKYRLIETVDYDPSGKTAGFVGNGKDQHCNAGSPCDPIDSSVVPPLLPNYTAARALTRTNADPEADFVSYSYTTCGSASGKLLKKEAVTNQVDAVSKCTGECNFVNIKDTEGYFYASCDIENDDTGSTLLQRKSTIATQSTSMQLIEKYYGDYQDVCMTKAMKGINDFSNLIKVPSGYRLVNGPGCTSGGTTSKQNSLINCAKKCTGDCSHATWNAQTEECRVCTGTYSPTQRGPCDLITVRPVPRGAAPNVSASDYKGFNAVIGHFCENRGYTNSIVVVSGAKTMQACANACLENTLCNFAQLDESGLCALLDVCPEYYPTDNDDLEVLVRTDFTTPTASIPETGDTSTSIDDSGTDNRSYTERLNALSFVPLIVTIFLVVPLIVVLIKVVPKKLQDPRHLLLACILIGTLIGCLGIIGIALSTTLILGDVHVVADAAAKQYTGVH